MGQNYRANDGSDGPDRRIESIDIGSNTSGVEQVRDHRGEWVSCLNRISRATVFSLMMGQNARNRTERGWCSGHVGNVAVLKSPAVSD